VTTFGIPLLLGILIVFAPSQIAHSQLTGGVPCQYEENCDCRVPGITLRWKAAYCMALSETDDFEHEGVQRCLATSDTAAVRKLRACQQNAHWKAMLCGVARDKQNVQACIRDRTFIPSIVARGAPIALRRMD
jgi:hypothetical protein